MPVTASSISMGMSPYMGVWTRPGATEFTRTPDAAACPQKHLETERTGQRGRKSYHVLASQEER